MISRVWEFQNWEVLGQSPVFFWERAASELGSFAMGTDILFGSGKNLEILSRGLASEHQSWEVARDQFAGLNSTNSPNNKLSFELRISQITQVRTNVKESLTNV